METLYVTFEVRVSNERYSHQGRRGDAEMKMQVPRTILENFDPGLLLTGVLSAALHNYDTRLLHVDEEDESE